MATKPKPPHDGHADFGHVRISYPPAHGTIATRNTSGAGVKPPPRPGINGPAKIIPPKKP